MRDHATLCDSRRAFLGSAAAALVAPVVLAACRRSRKQASAPPADAAAQPHNLDDVGELATFRPPLPTSEPIVRVRVMRVRDSATAVPLRIGERGQWITLRRERADGEGGRERGRGDDERERGEGGAPPSAIGQAMQGPLEITMTNTGWSITDGKGFRASIPREESIELTLPADHEGEAGAEPGAEGVIAIATSSAGGNAAPSSSSSSSTRRAYRGALRLISRHDLDTVDRKGKAIVSRAFDVINHVPLEEYLPGVLAGELFAGWQLETFCAQAIAARSFACTEAAIFAGRRHYDLSNTAASQMYLGAVAHDKAHRAAAVTRGIVLAYANLLVSGYYSSCCGGVAASAVDAIGGGAGGANPVNSVPPLRGRSGSDVCTDAPVHSWTVQQPIDQLVQRLAGFGRERQLKTLESLTRLLAIDVAATNEHGRPTRIAITGTALANSISRRDGSASEQSDATSRPGAEQAQEQQEEQVHIELSAEDFRRAANFSSDGSASAGGGASASGGAGGGGVIKPPPKDQELRSSNIRASIVGSTVIFQGHGFGHGVGLCQYGAEALAKSGTPHQEILRWYYPDVEIVRAYG